MQDTAGAARVRARLCYKVDYVLRPAVVGGPHEERRPGNGNKAQRCDSWPHRGAQGFTRVHRGAQGRFRRCSLWLPGLRHGPAHAPCGASAGAAERKQPWFARHSATAGVVCACVCDGGEAEGGSIYLAHTDSHMPALRSARVMLPVPSLTQLTMACIVCRPNHTRSSSHQ